MAAEIRCTECEWEGRWEDLNYPSPGNPENAYCPACEADAGPDGCMEEITGDPAILDQAIAGSIALDPAGGRKPAHQLLVPTPEQKEAEYRRLARVIADMEPPR